jgi:hypothetical protein
MLECSSTAGAGTTFTIRLPLVREPAGGRPLATESAAGDSLAPAA